MVEWLIHGGRSTQSESDESEYGAVSGQSEYLTKATMKAEKQVKWHSEVKMNLIPDESNSRR